MISWPTQLSIRRQLLILVLALTVPAVALFAWVSNSLYREVTDAAHAKLDFMAEGVAHNIEELLGDNERVLRHLSERPLIRAVDSKRCDPILGLYIEARPEYSTLAVRDVEGNIVCSRLGNPPSTQLVRQAGWFRKALQSRTFTVGDATARPAPPGWVSISASPIWSVDNALVGFVFFSVDLLKLNAQLFQGLPGGAVIEVVDGNDNFLLRSVDPALWIGRSAAGVVSTAGQAPGYFSHEGVDHVRRIYRAVAVPGTDWRVFAGLPEDEVLAVPRQYLTRGAAIGAAVLGLMVLLAWIIARGIARPILELAGTSTKLASGEGGVRARIEGPREVQHVAAEFNRMLDVREREGAERVALAAHYNNLFRLARDAMLLIDPEDRIVEANDAAVAMYGYSPEEWPTLHIQDLRARPPDEATLAKLQAAVEVEGALFEIEHRRKDGTLCPVEVSTRPLEIDGKRYRQAVIRDITIRKRTEAALIGQETRYRTVVRSSMDGFWILDRSGRILEVNDRYCRRSGYSREQLLKLTLFDIEATQAPEEIRRSLATCEQEDARIFEAWHRARDGSIWPVEVSTLFLPDEGGRFFSFLRDISERKHAEKVLLDSEQQLRTVMDTLPGYVSQLDREFRYRRVNARYLKLLGKPASEFMGRHVREVLGEAEWKNLKPYLERAAAGESLEFDLRSEYQGHRGRWLRRSVTPEFDGAGRVSGIVILAQDLTPQKVIDDLVRKLSRAVEQSPASIVITDREGRIEYVNPRFTEITGYTAEEALGQNPRIIKSGKTPAEVYADLWRTISAGRQWRGELCNRAKNGQLFWEYAAISGLTDEGGLVSHFIAVKNDITEQKRAYGLLGESEERFRAMFNGSPVGIIITRLADGKLLEFNDAALRLFGYRRDEVAGRTVAELGSYPAEEGRRLLDALGRHGQVDGFEIHARHRSGGDVRLSVSARVVSIRQEQCMVAMLVDATERSKLEEIHLQAQKLESLGTLAGGIAHDFNNIIAAIRGNADLAARELVPGHPAMTSLTEIGKAGLRASELVRRILAFARPHHPDRRPSDLATVVEEVLRLLRSTLPAGIALVKNFQAGVPPALVDASQVHEAVVNLTTNAAQAIGRRPGMIEYQVEAVDVDLHEAERLQLEPGRYVRLSVRDNGCGIDQATQSRIFDAFFTTKPIGEGTGLGLSMVYGIMHSHGGAISVESAPGQGATFRLYFPAQQRTGKNEPRPVCSGVARERARRILFVDDEEALVSVAVRALAPFGQEVCGFTEPRAALAAFRENPARFDIAVTDLSMPEMSGFDLARELRALRPDLPILMMTGYLTPGEESIVHETGIGEILFKPCELEDLLEAFRRLEGKVARSHEARS